MTDTETNALDKARQIAGFLSDGYAIKDIREFLEQQAPDADHDAIIATALDFIERDADQIAGAGQKIALDAYRRLFRDLRKIGDFSGALRAAQAIEKLTQTVVTTAEQQQDQNLQRLMSSI